MNFISTLSFHPPPPRAAIYANKLYLSLTSRLHPEILAGGSGEMDGEGPLIEGHVRIDPSAHVDATATVSAPVIII